MLGSAGDRLSVGDIQVAMEVWSLEGRPIPTVQMGKHEQGDGTRHPGHGHHHPVPSMEQEEERGKD